MREQGNRESEPVEGESRNIAGVDSKTERATLPVYLDFEKDI